jgi:hypothetical protein
VSDPNFSSLALALHCDGTDASTTFTDISNNVKTVTAASGAEIDTAQSKFGGASGLFPGGSSRLSVPDNTDFRFTTGTFSIRFWVRFSNIASADLQYLVCKSATTGESPWAIYYDPFSGFINAFSSNTSGTQLFTLTKNTTIAVDTWYFVEYCRNGSTFRLFVDGVAASTATSSADLYASVNSVRFGQDANTGDFPLEGWLDDIQIYKGFGGNTSNYTRPSAAFEGAPPPPGIATETDTALALLPPGVLSGPVGRANETDTAVDAVRSGRIADDGLPSAPSILSRLNLGWLVADSPLGAPTLRSDLVFGRLTDSGPLGTPRLTVFSDFTPYLAVEQRQRYWMDLTTPGGVVRVPVSSWQSTQQTGAQCYAGCVVPACEPYLADLYAATEFAIVREGTLKTGARFEIEMVRCPLDTLQTDEGPTNLTASLAGYFDAFPEVEDPDAQFDRVLTGVRSVSVYASGVRFRCDIDWLLRPGQRAQYEATTFLVSYINYYVTQNLTSVDAYMDIGERN